MATFSLITITSGATFSINGKTRGTHSEFDDSSTFSISPSKANAIINSKTQGMFGLSGSGVVKSAKQVIAKSTKRAGKINNMLDLKKYFEKKKILILGGSLGIEINLPLNAEEFFYAKISFTKNEQELEIPQKLKHKEKQVIISKRSLYKGINAHEVKLNKAVRLHYLHKIKEELMDEEIAKFQPIFINKLDLQAPFNRIKKSSHKKDFEKNALCFLNYLYAEPDKENFDKWFKRHFAD